MLELERQQRDAEWQEEQAAGFITAAAPEQLCVAEALVRGGVHVAAHLTGLRQLVVCVLVEVATLVGYLQREVEAQAWVHDAARGQLGQAFRGDQFHGKEK